MADAEKFQSESPPSYSPSPPTTLPPPPPPSMRHAFSHSQITSGNGKTVEVITHSQLQQQHHSRNNSVDSGTPFHGPFTIIESNTRLKQLSKTLPRAFSMLRKGKKVNKSKASSSDLDSETLMAILLKGETCETCMDATNGNGDRKNENVDSDSVPNQEISPIPILISDSDDFTLNTDSFFGELSSLLNLGVDAETEGLLPIPLIPTSSSADAETEGLSPSLFSPTSSRADAKMEDFHSLLIPTPPTDDEQNAPTKAPQDLDDGDNKSNTSSTSKTASSESNPSNLKKTSSLSELSTQTKVSEERLSISHLNLTDSIDKVTMSLHHGLTEQVSKQVITKNRYSDKDADIHDSNHNDLEMLSSMEASSNIIGSGSSESSENDWVPEVPKRSPSMILALPTIGKSSVPVKHHTMKEIVTTYSHALPTRVKILQGYCCESSDINLRKNAVYDIHAIEHKRMLMVRDDDEMIHAISPQAHVKIGLIYNPINNIKQSLNGFEFRSVSDITSVSVLPRLIAATRTVASKEDKNRVSEGEIFIIKDAYRSILKRKKGLKVISLLTRSSKVLLDNCQGHFTTKPSSVKMDLPEFLKRVNDLSSLEAVLYPSNSLSSDFPGSSSRVVTLMECNIQTTLMVSDVSSSVNENPLEEANLYPIQREDKSSFDLLLDDQVSNLKVAVFNWTSLDSPLDCSHHELDGTRTQRKMSSNGEKTSTLLSNSSALIHHTPQQQDASQLSVTTSKDNKEDLKFLKEDEDAGYDTVGLHLIRKTSLQSPLSSNENSSTLVSTSSHGYSTIGKTDLEKKTLPFPDHHYSTVSKHRSGGSIVIRDEADLETMDSGEVETDTQRTLTSSDDERDHFSVLVKGLESKLQLLQSTQHSVEMTKMQLSLDILSKKLESVESQLSSLAMSSSTMNQPKPVEQEKRDEEVNRECLKSLDVHQVGEVMEVMGLGQYKNTILEEQISGEILLECDDSVLQNELGVSSKIHRIRIMKLITGHHSAKTLLENRK